MAEATAHLVEGWFEKHGWAPFDFQRDVWQAMLNEESGLLHAPTGVGKTYAVWFGALLHWMEHTPRSTWDDTEPPRLKVVWLTPLKALAADTHQALLTPLDELNVPWTVERLTGDTSSYAKQKIVKKPPSALITTPESLSILLSRAQSKRIFSRLTTVVVDEWHELMGGKRGVQTELCLARLRRWRPSLSAWGVSATLGNLEEALAALVGVDSDGVPRGGRVVRGLMPKETRIDALIPPTMERFPWAGHLGLKMLPQVIEAIQDERTSLIFCNTRNQVEQWYQALIKARPDWIGRVALHHGSLAKASRQWVEEGLRAGTLKCVVATSSLELGVDLPTVDRVLQVGSPKGVARLLQRAGRSGHRPGEPSRVTCVPTHAFELIEVAAVREAAARRHVEPRPVIENPLDLLSQHVVTLALGGGFSPEELYDEIRTAYAFRHLSREEWHWVIDFVTTGGQSLRAYDEYRKVVVEEGTYTVTDRRIANVHRSNIGTIVSDAQMQVKYLKGGTLGSINESFVSRMKRGDRFIFAGKPLEFVRIRDMTVYVRRVSSVRGAIPRWAGTTLPISDELGAMVRELLGEADRRETLHPELVAVKPVLDVQRTGSQIPEADQLLIERIKTREGHHLFIYPFAGRLVHEGLSALVSYRLSRLAPATYTLTSNDYGFELLSPQRAPLDEAGEALFSTDHLLDDIRRSLNESEMAKRQFREIARVAGLVHQGPVWQRKSARQIQSTSGLLYDVFEKYDPDNLLLGQAHREVLERQLEQSRLVKTLDRIQRSEIVIAEPPRPTPFCFPLLVTRIQARLSSEKLADRIQRMTLQLEKWAG